MQLLAVIIRAINEKNFFNVSHKRANVSLGPSPKGLYFSLLGEIFFSPFLKKGNASNYRRQFWVKLSPDPLKNSVLQRNVKQTGTMHKN